MNEKLPLRVNVIQQSCDCEAEFLDHDGGVQSIDVQGSLIMSGSEDTQIFIHDLAQVRVCCSFFIRFCSLDTQSPH